MTSDAWQKLLDSVEQAALETAANATSPLRWVRPNRLVLMDRWQVQARFVAEPAMYSIYLERFGAELGDANFESTPHSGQPKRTVLTMLLEVSNGEAFWRFSDGQTLPSRELASRMLARLRTFHDEYGMSIIAPGY
jgi:hypothetical protein